MGLKDFIQWIDDYPPIWVYPIQRLTTALAHIVENSIPWPVPTNQSRS